MNISYDGIWFVKENMITFVKFVITYVLILSSIKISAQSKYGKDEQACKENVSVLENIVNKNYEDALNPGMGL